MSVVWTDEKHSPVNTVVVVYVIGPLIALFADGFALITVLLVLVVIALSRNKSPVSPITI